MSPIWRRRRRHTQQRPEQLLTRARIADFIGRDKARVSHYASSGQLPEPDAQTPNGDPLWYASTIRSWWADRGGTTTAGSNRLHQPVDPEDRRPDRLEEVITPIPRGSRWGHEITIHARVYAGLDGCGPIVLVGHTDTTYPADADWVTVIERLKTTLASDVDHPETLWLYVAAERPRMTGLDPTLQGEIPEEIVIVDLTDQKQRHDLQAEQPDKDHITPADVGRLIGNFDVYPQDHYSPDTITRRRIDPGQIQDTPTPTVESVDHNNLLKLLAQLHTLDNATKHPPTSSDHQETYRFAAGVIAELAHTASSRNADEIDYLDHYQRDDQDQLTDHHPYGATLAIWVRFRTLSATEDRFVHHHLPDQPLVLTSRPPTNRTEREHTDTVPILREDTHHQRDLLRQVLNDPDLAEDHPARDALNEAERYVTACINQADPEREWFDRAPIRVSWRTHDTTLSAYLNQLQPYQPQDVPRDLQRRARLLTQSEAAQRWSGGQLLYDDTNDLLAWCGSEPSRYDEDEAREHVRRLYQPAGAAPLSPEALEQLVTDTLADTPMVRMEWPTAPWPTNPKQLTGHTLESGTGSEKPVFLRHKEDGHLTPLPSWVPDRIQGFAFGINNTDTLSPVLYRLITDQPQRDHLTYPLETEDPGWATYRWLRAYVYEQSHANGGGYGPTTFDGDSLLARTTELLSP